MSFYYRKFSFFCCLYFFTFLCTVAQQTKLINYSVKDGLPSSEVHYVYQDHKGYMWFCTDAGLAKFDGYKFKVYTTSDGLTDNTVFSVFEDKHSRIWLRTFNGRICYILNDTVFKIDANPLIEKDLAAGILSSMFMDEKDTLWIGKQNFKDQCFYKIASPYKKNDFQKCFFKGDTVVGICNIKINKDNYIFSEKKRNVDFKSTLIENKFYDYRKEEVSVVSGIEMHKDPNSKFMHINDTSLWINNNSIYRLYKNNCLHSWNLKYHILSMYIDTRGSIWLGTMSNGVHHYSSKELTKEINCYLKDCSITGICEDSQHGIWFSTLESGVFYMPFRDYQFYDKTNGLPDNYVTALCISHKKEMVIGFKNGDYCFVEKKDNISDNIKFNVSSTLNYINCIKEIEPNHFLIGNQNSHIKNNKVNFHNKFFSVNNFKEFCFTNKNIYAIKVSLMFSLNKETLKITDTLILNSRINCIENHKDGGVWLGTINGLYFYKNKNLQYFGDKNSLLKWRINDLAYTSDSVLIIATKGEGILMLKNDKVINQITIKDGLLSNLCTHVYVDNEGCLWASTNEGLSKIAINKNLFSVIKNYTTQNGLLSSEVNDMRKLGDTMWLATKQGLSFFSITEKRYDFPLYINNISTNNKTLVIDSSYSIPYNENNISINYNAICFKSLGKIKYRYKFREEDTLWEYTYNTKLNFPSLTYGEYKFCIQAVNVDGLFSEKKIIHFTIDKPFWLSWWFIILVFFLLIITTIYIVYKRYDVLLKREKKGLKLTNRIHELEMKALRAQMNPHFIFNSLNSIQQLILSNDNDNAYKYLSKFSKLIRKILISSIDDSVSINEEINTLKLYLEIESLRFENSFVYRIYTDDILNQEEIYIPNMIIQPYVENALWHGLMHKEGERVLEIKFKIHDNFIICTIEDNGIGRKKSQEIKQQRESLVRSFGMQITKERIEIINKQYDNKATVGVKIIDKTTEEGTSSGTLVEIIIPYFVKK